MNKKVEQLLSRMMVAININQDTEEVRRIGKYKDGENRPIKIKLVRERKKLEIMRKTNNLKGTKIWVEEDYTKEIQRERKELIPHLKEAREKGYSAKLRYNKLIVNNEIYTAQELTTKIPQIEKSNENKRSRNERLLETDTEQLNKLSKISKNF